MDKKQIQLNKLISEYNELDKRAIENKFNQIDLIIQLEKDYSRSKKLLYKHIKIWMIYYLKSIEKKKFSYDQIFFEKIIEKVNYLEAVEQINILNFFIRTLKRYSFQEEIFQYEEYKKTLELKYLIVNKSYFNFFLKWSTQNLLMMSITLFFIFLIFSFLWYLLQETLLVINIPLHDITAHIFLNYFFNIISFVFTLTDDFNVTNICELLLLIVIKFTSYIYITYFIIKEISKKMEN